MINLVWKLIVHHPVRTFIGIIQSFISSFMLLFVISIINVQNTLMNQSINLFQVNAGNRSGSTSSTARIFSIHDLNLILKLCPDIKKLDITGIEYVYYIEIGSKRYKVSSSKSTGSEYSSITGLKIVKGNYFNKNEMINDSRVIVLSQNTAIELFGKDDVIGKSVKIALEKSRYKPVTYKIIGISQNSDRDGRGVASPVFKPVSLDVSSKATGLIALSHNGRADEAKAQITSALQTIYKEDISTFRLKSNGNQGFYFTAVSSQLSTNSNDQKILLKTYYYIAGLISVIIAMGALSVPLARDVDRSREIAMRRAIGASHRQVIQTLLFEIVINKLIGAFLGILVLILSETFVNSHFSSILNGISFHISLSDSMVVLGFLIAIYSGFSLSPVILSNRLSISEGLRMNR